MNLFEYAEEMRVMEVIMFLKKPNHAFIVVEPIYKDKADESIKEAKIEVIANFNNP